jgi:hypothetical protein
MSTVPLSIALFDELLMRGNFYSRHDYITGNNFPDVKQVTYNPNLIRHISIDNDMPTEWVLSLIKKKAMYPATVYHGLNYAAANPDMEMKLPIVCLGTVFPYVEEGFPASKQVPHCVVLQDMSHRRGINVSAIHGKWGKGCSFLAYTI